MLLLSLEGKKNMKYEICLSAHGDKFPPDAEYNIKIPVVKTNNKNIIKFLFISSILLKEKKLFIFS